MQRDENSFYLYDEPYGPYQPRSILRKQAEPPPSPDPVPAAPDAPPSPLSLCCRQTKIRIEKRFERFLEAVFNAMKPHTAAFQALRKVFEEFAAEELREDGPSDPKPRAA